MISSLLMPFERGIRVAGGLVLLGESHDTADQHRWQLQTIAALQARGVPLTLGFEMFPRRVQPLLDEWTVGGFSEGEFLDAVEWDRVWGFDPGLYMPLFHFARVNRLPMVALNVERGLIAAVRETGWDAVPAANREGISDPAQPEPAYRESLSAVYLEHLEMRDRQADPVGLERFIQAQLTWDRAMAAALAAGGPVRVGYTLSFVDGIGSPIVQPEMYALAIQLIDGSLLASLEETASAVKLMAERNHVIAEGAGGVSVAAVLAGRAGGGKVVCIVSGGNIDPAMLVTVLEGGVPPAG